METSAGRPHFAAALKINNLRLMLGAVGFFTIARSALAVAIAFQIYQLTHSVLALGWLGLIEAIPAILLAPFGGYVCDHYPRQTILIVTRLVSFFCALALAFFSWRTGAFSLFGIYAMIFLAGVARGFADPASNAFEAQVVPKHLTVNASSWIGSVWISCAIAGPAAAGFIFDALGAAGLYAIIAGSYGLSLVLTALIVPSPQVYPETKQSVFKSIRTGWRALLNIQALLASMILDLFAVFFGGAMILLPVYATDILQVGAKGLGLLNAAPSVGALIVTLFATRHPPIHKAGRTLLISIAGFGLSIICFAFSRNFYLSLFALFLSGGFDGISMVIRRSMMRLLSPDNLRGRIAATGSIFITASNELGAFESGMLAALIGTVPCVAVGGVITLMVVGLTAKFAPELRNLSFDLGKD